MSDAFEKLDEILVETGILKLDKLKEVWSMQGRTGRSVEEIVIQLGYATKRDVCMAKAKCIGVEYVDLSNYEIKDSRLSVLIPKPMALRYMVFPVALEENVLTVAMKDPRDIFMVDDLHLSTALNIKPVFSDVEDIKALIGKLYQEKKQEIKEPVTGIEEKNENYHDHAASSTVSAWRSISAGKDKLISQSDNAIAEKFIHEGKITKEQLQKAVTLLKEKGGTLGNILVQEKYIDKITYYIELEKHFGVKYIDLSKIEIPDEIVCIVNEKLAQKHVVVPLEKDGIRLKVAMSDPTNIFMIDDLRLATGMEIIPVLADHEDILSVLNRRKTAGKVVPEVNAGNKAVISSKIEVKNSNLEIKDEDGKILDFDEELKKVNKEIAVEIDENAAEESIQITDVQNAPIVKMVNLIFNRAIHNKASDIHIEPYENYLVIRNRIDGQLVEIMRHDRKLQQALVARIKIISGLNIAERRIPQDGRISINVSGRDYDMRVSVLPAMFGEKVVIRLADKQGFDVKKQELGFSEEDMKKFDSILSHPHGVVLVTGPTGSGKSTTLYTALKELSKPTINILTVEDPVESTIEGINQVQVNTKAGLTFAMALRAFLRQDPDIIMVGEIRDSETAEIAIRAAITGHLVLSTLHTNDAASSITRMIDMGVEPYIISSSIAGVIAQRLVRRLCPKCREEYEPSENEKQILRLGEENCTLFRPKGCEACSNTGYKGRIAIYEIMVINTEITELISKNVPPSVLKEAALRNGMCTLRDSCSKVVKAGITSMDELLRVTLSDNRNDD